MKVFKVRLSWLYGSDEEANARRKKRCEILTSLDITPPAADDSLPLIIVDAVKLAELLAAGESAQSVEAYTLSSDTHESVLARFEAVAKKLSSLPLESAIFNERCEVHMPGQALSTYNDTLLIEDSCTDVLQDALNNGWRIIACCPQPDSRRPDYLLGRFNPDLSTNGNPAKRNPKDV